MKNLFPLFLLFFTVTIFAQPQSWDISPIGQRTYFETPNGSIQLHHIDSVEIFPNYRKHYFGAKYLTQGFEECYDEILNYIPPNTLVEHPIEVWYSNDSVFYFLENTDTIRFYHKSPIGFSWVIPEYDTNNDFNQIQITCSSIEAISFLGITDSVRFFELQTLQDSSPISSDLNNEQIRLSKNHGLLERFFLRNFSFASQKISGIHNDNISVGFDFKFENMMQNFAAGDVYKWKSTGLGNFPLDAHEEWRRDSFLQVTHYSDSIVIYLNREYALFPANSTLYNDTIFQFSPNTKKVISKFSFGKLFSTPSNYLFSGFQYLDPINFSNFENLKIDENDVFDFDIRVDTYWYDSLGCELNEFIGTIQTLSYNSKVGYYRRYAPGFSGGREEIMVGYIQGNEMIGDYSPIYQMLTPSKNLITPTIDFEIFPNPTADILFFEIKNQQKSQIEIYNSLGKIVFENEIYDLKNEIDISNLPLGTYLFFVKNKDGIGQKLFIKKSY